MREKLRESIFESRNEMLTDAAYMFVDISCVVERWKICIIFQCSFNLSGTEVILKNYALISIFFSLYTHFEYHKFR